MDRLDDPVDAGIAADGLVLGVDQDDFVVLVGGVLVDPVGVQDTQVGGMATDTLLSGGLERALVLELVDTLVGGLACIHTISHLPISRHFQYGDRTIGGTLGSRALAATTANTDTVDNVSLLGLVSETTSLVGAGRTGSAVDHIKLTELY